MEQKKTNVIVENYKKECLKTGLWTFLLLLVMIVLTGLMVAEAIKAKKLDNYIWSCVCSALAFSLFVIGAPNLFSWFKINADVKKNDIEEFKGKIDSIDFIWDKKAKTAYQMISGVKLQVKVPGKYSTISYTYTFPTKSVCAYYYSNKVLDGLLPDDEFNFTYYKRSRFIENFKSYGEVRNFESYLSKVLDAKFREKTPKPQEAPKKKSWFNFKKNK